MALYPFDLSLGIAQLSTALSGAIGLANGYETATSYSVDAGGTNYTLGDQVSLTGGTGTAAVFFVVGVSAGGVVTAVSHEGNFGCTPVSGFYISGSTPGTTGVATTNIKVANAAASGLTITVGYGSQPPKGTQSVILQASSLGGQPLIFTTDGTPPSSSNGLVVNVGDSWPITTKPANVLVIAGGGGAVANVLFLATVGNVSIGQ